MKRFLILAIHFFMLSICILSFGNKASASYTAPNGNEYQNYYHVTATDGTFDIYCDNYLVASEEAMTSTVYKLLYPFNSENNDSYGLYQLRSVYQNYNPSYNFEYGQNRDGEVIYTICLSQNGNTPQVNSYLYCTQANLESAGIEIYSTNESALQNAVANDIDFEHPYYNPMLAVPEVEILYQDAEGQYDMPISVALKNAASNLFVEVVAVNYSPSIVKCEYVGGSPQYSALFSHKFQQHDIISHSELKVSSDVSSDYIGDVLDIAWMQDIINYPVSEIGYSNQIGTDSTAIRAFNNMKDMYANLRTVGLFFGNNTELYFRYFMIEDDKFIVSAWRTWTSQYSSNFGTQVPEYYKTYSVASGYENTNTDTSIVISPTSVPDANNPSNQTGTKKGGGLTINIGQNVPNYPDYPTIASYNLDNLLVSAIDNVKGLGNFFSGFAGFCTVTFAWIPQEIWQVIAIGFALSIVVMFLKIL